MIINPEETDRGPSDNDSVPCLVCQEAIRKGAKKCIHCDSYQGRLSHRLTLSSTILSLLVALVSVSAFAIPIIHKALNPGADIRATVVGSQENFMQLVVTNVGSQPGTFRWAAIMRPNVEIKKGVKGALQWPLNRIQGWESKTLISANRTVYSPPYFEAQVIKPGELVTMVFKSEYFLPTLAGNKEEWKLIIGVVQFDGKLGTKESIFKCESEKEVGQPVSSWHPLPTKKK